MFCRTTLSQTTHNEKGKLIQFRKKQKQNSNIYFESLKFCFASVVRSFQNFSVKLRLFQEYSVYVC